MMKKDYSNGEITIEWTPEKCIHSGICVKTLPKVYNPKEKPWIKIENATTEQLIDQVAKCPSGALKIRNENEPKIEREDNGKKGRFIITLNAKLTGEMTYTWAGQDKLIIDHTEIDTQYGGRGYGKQLVMKAVDFARNENIKIIPLCPFAKKVFDTDKNLADVLF